MANAFDQALELTDVLVAAERYALRRGEPGSAAYFVAWLRFRRRVRTGEDLRRLRAAAEARQRARRAIDAHSENSALADQASVLRAAPLARPHRAGPVRVGS